MAEQIVHNRISTIPDYGSISNSDELDAITGFATAYVYIGVGLGSEGNVFCLPFSKLNPGATQIFIGYQGSLRKIRTLNWDTGIWSEWESL